MKGLIVISSAYRHHILDNYWYLFKMLKEKHGGFDIQYTDSPTIPSDIDVLIVHFQRTYTGSMMNLEHVDRKIKMVGIIGDMHSLDLWGDNGLKMLARYDVILSDCKEEFLKRYPQFAHKFVWIPSFFAPHERYARFPFNEKPVPKCLVSGRLEPINFYGLKHYVVENADKGKISFLKHPGYHPDEETLNRPDVFVGARFAALLNVHLCGLTNSIYLGGWANNGTSKVYYSDFVGAYHKHIAIPAAGSLLLTEQCKDFDEMGFVPYEHYIPVTKDNVLEEIDAAIDGKYSEVRKAGMEFARANHSIKNRFKQIDELL